jgi:hypothetical protein
MNTQELVPALARRVFGAVELGYIGRGDLAGAIRTTNVGGLDTELRWQVEGQHVIYRARPATTDHRMPLRALAEWAASVMTTDDRMNLDACYRAYVQAATTPYTLNRRDPAYQADPELMQARADAADAASRALTAAVRRCLAEHPAPAALDDGGLFPEPPRQRRRPRAALVGAAR